VDFIGDISVTNTLTRLKFYPDIRLRGLLNVDGSFRCVFSMGFLILYVYKTLVALLNDTVLLL
jgi:hypothetical protein